MSIQRDRAIWWTCLAVMVMAIAATTQAAQPSESGAVTRADFPIGLVFEEEGIMVISGPSFEEGCLDEGFSEPP